VEFIDQHRAELIVALLLVIAVGTAALMLIGLTGGTSGGGGY
jgi:hypothetical protein